MAETVKTLTLPQSGKTATIRSGKGRDMRAIHRLTNGAPEDATFAMIAVLAQIDGQPVLFEDVLEMDIPDISALSDAIGQNFSPTPTKSSTSAQ